MSESNSLKSVYLSLTRILIESHVIGGIVRLQHRHFPLPIVLFDMLFGHRVMARLFAFYGHHVFQADYANRPSNEEYWLGQRSLYWHLYRQHDVFKLPTYPAEILELFGRGDLTFAEPGFGIGKQARHLLANGVLRFKSYIAAEPNDYARAYAARHMPEFTYKAGELSDLLSETFDVLVINGGVLMYCDLKTVDEFFARLPETGCNYVVVMGEGGPREVVRPDNTTMYAFKDRLLTAYPKNAFVEEISPAGQYAAFAMLDAG